ncbi:MAG: hypothetical protein HC904_14415 [Blastochloris sp.]|nr:hypothetical protein [Blastochloris sp.]
MNPELLNRVRAGAFARIVLPEEEQGLSGYIAQDPDRSDSLRFDTLMHNESGYLEKVSLSLPEKDLLAVHFLPEAPSFVDVDGNAISLQEGFDAGG